MLNYVLANQGVRARIVFRFLVRERPHDSDALKANYDMASCNKRMRVIFKVFSACPCCSTQMPNSPIVRNSLLLICNALLRRLSKAQETVFCGRILMFLANLIPIEDKSGMDPLLTCRAGVSSFENTGLSQKSEESILARLPNR
jgi:hypothetical protein